MRYRNDRRSFLQEEAQNYRDYSRVKRVDFAWWAGRIAYWCSKQFVLFLITWRVLVLWCVVAGVLLLAVSPEARVFVVIGLCVLLVALGVLARFYPVAERFLPIWADVRRVFDKRRVRAVREGAYELLEHFGIISIEDAREMNLDASFIDENNQAVLELYEPIKGVSYGELETAFTNFKDVVNASAGVRVRHLPNGGARAVFLREDPLDLPSVITDPKPLDPNTMSVVCAVDDQGNEQSLTFKNNSGMVLAGLAGSGKTASACSFLLPLALSPYVALTIYDGKSGSDWRPYAGVAEKYLSDDGDLDKVLDLVEKHYKKLKHRANTMYRDLGTANFWNATAEARLRAGIKFEVLVLDECQQAFSTLGRSKEDKTKIDQIKRMVSDLIRMGRSYGLFVLLMTQKPTDDAIPTMIRDNCGIRVSLRVGSRSNAQVILGELPDDTPEDVLPTRIPRDRKGGGVLTNDAGDMTAVRFFYIDEQRQNQLLSQGV